MAGFDDGILPAIRWHEFVRSFLKSQLKRVMLAPGYSAAHSHGPAGLRFLRSFADTLRGAPDITVVDSS